MACQTLRSENERGAKRPFRAYFFSVFILLAILVCLLPIDTLPDDQIFLLPIILIAAGAPVWLGLGARYRFSLIALVSIASLIFLMVHWLFSDWPWMSLWLGSCLALMPVGVLVTCNDGVSEYVERALPGVVVALGALNSLAIIYQAKTFGGRPGGFLADPNLGANIVGIAVLCSAYLYLSRRSSHWVLGVVVLMSAALFFAQSRGAWIALLCSGSVFSLFFLVSTQRSRQRLFLFVLALMTGFVLVLAITGGSFAEAVGFGERSKSLGYRFEIWGSAWELALQRPLLGSGIGTFPLRYPAVRSPLETSTTGHFAHSDIIQLVVELGLPGTLLFTAVPLMFVYLWSKSIRRHGVTFGLPVLAFCVLMLVGLHGLVNFVIYQPLVALTVGLLIGLGARGLGKEVGFTFNAPVRRLIVGGSVSVMAFLSIMSAADLLASKKIADVAQSNTQYNLQSNTYYDLLFLEMFSPLNINIKNHIVEAEVATAMGLVGSDLGFHFRQQVIERIEKNRRLYEPNCVQLSERGRLLWTDDREEAVAALESLIRAAPNCYRAYLYLSEAYLDQRRFADAERLLEGAFERFKFGEVDSKQASILLDALAEALARQGRAEEARSVEAFSRSN